MRTLLDFSALEVFKSLCETMHYMRFQGHLEKKEAHSNTGSPLYLKSAVCTLFSYLLKMPLCCDSTLRKHNILSSNFGLVSANILVNLK